jgi:hypothetical protein
MSLAKLPTINPIIIAQMMLNIFDLTDHNNPTWLRKLSPLAIRLTFPMRGIPL